MFEPLFIIIYSTLSCIPLHVPLSHTTKCLPHITSHAAAQGDCSLDELTDAQRTQMEIYDKDLYLDPNCTSSVGAVHHCNYMGIAPDCRGCYSTCEGALLYMEDFMEEYEFVVRTSLTLNPSGHT